MIKFSIIVPIYNVERYISHCIDSILQQSFSDYEVILIDDGSIDESGRICDIYAEKYERIHVSHVRNKGPSSARNIGVQLARGEYILFVDSDDWMVESGLQIASLACDTSNGADIIINRCVSYYSDTNQYIESYYYFDIKKMVNMEVSDVLEKCYSYPTFWAAPWSFIIRRDYILKYKLFFVIGIYHEDEEWAPRLILNARSIYFNNECIYCNRSNRENSITQSVNIKKEFDKLLIINILENESRKCQYEKKQKRVLLKRCSSLYLGVLGNAYQYKNIEKVKYNYLLSELKSKKKVLLYNRKYKYLLVYIFIHLFGVFFMNLILHQLRRKKCY